jgi:hypothetical protein
MNKKRPGIKAVYTDELAEQAYNLYFTRNFSRTFAGAVLKLKPSTVVYLARRHQRTLANA